MKAEQLTQRSFLFLPLSLNVDKSLTGKEEIFLISQRKEEKKQSKEGIRKENKEARRCLEAYLGTSS